MTKEPDSPDGPIVAAVREARRQMAAECGYDLRRLVKMLRAKEAASGRQPVSLKKTKTYTT